MRKLLFVMISVAAFSITATAQEPKVATAAQVNGIYRYYDNEFRVLALGHNKLKVQFEGVYHTVTKSVHLGSALGEATIEGNVATFFPEDGQACKITMTFLPGKLMVKQDGQDFACGFGANVNAAGTYRKIRGGQPKFKNPSIEQSSEEHRAWIEHALKRMEAVKPGMMRADLLKVFSGEGGLSTGLRRTYVFNECPYFKVDVEFTPVGRPARDADGRVTLVESDSDIIKSISRPYLDWSVSD